MQLGEKIRNAREDADLSQRAVAEQIPMNQSNYSKIERGAQEPSILQLRRICEILSLDPRYLLGLGAYKDMTDKEYALFRQIRQAINKFSEFN